MKYVFTDDVTLVGRLPTGESVVIEVYNLNNTTLEVVSSNVCAELANTGLYSWKVSNITSAPAVFTEYVYTMIDTQNNRYDGKFVLTGIEGLTATESTHLLSLPTATEQTTDILDSIP